jgi:hypothetical protein
MFSDPILDEHLKSSSSLSVSTTVVAEWNMNVSEKIKQVGNYRNRPSDPNSPYKNISTYFDQDDVQNAYTGATDSDITLDGGYDDEGIPITFVSKRKKMELLFSLEDCLGKFRPRSGINKVLFGSNKYLHFPNQEMAKRPRYYMADRTDPFKYWTSYREEDAQTRGIATTIINGRNYIDDAAPFIVYEEPVPANRIVVKMQTNVGSENFGVFTNVNESFSDPFYGYENQSTPVNWRIQYLSGEDWSDAITFNAGSRRSDGTNIIGSDGYVEIGYGLIIPQEYRTGFRLQSRIYPSDVVLPDPVELDEGTAFFIKTSDYDKGRFGVVITTVDGNEYAFFNAMYGWYLEEEEINSLTNYVTVLSDPGNPDYNVVYKESTGHLEFREFKYINGLRVVVDTMNKFESTFDLIELSPRLKVNLSDRVKNISITKTASDIGISGMPVGQLLASTGSIDLFDYDQSFFTSNTKSIVSNYTSQNIQFKVYETIQNISGTDYSIPVKVMYSEGFPELSNKDRSATINLRDLFFYMETMTAPQLFLQNASLSSAVSILLDYIGFSNYVFKRNPGESEIVIPYFYVAPDKTIAEVLSDLAISAQAAMFFDEYNNLVVMSKGYMMPSIAERSTDTTLIGSNDFAKNGVYANEATSSSLANIMDLASQDTSVFNDGSINYTSSYIQKSYSSLKQANLVDRDKNWVYKSSLLWEVSPSERTKSINEELNQMSAYALTAMTLNSTLTANVPSVSNGQIINNIIDFGDSVYWIGRYDGYFYANGEVIKYDAVEYSVRGMSDTDIILSSADGYNVWISSVQEYQKYFAKMPFGGKMYPTGRVRIYTEPEYYDIGDFTKIRSIKKHGRGQFGTKIVEHTAGIDQYWTTNPDTLHGVKMNNKYLFSSKLDIEMSDAFSEVLDRGEATFSDYPIEISTKITATKIVSEKHGLVSGNTVIFNTTGNLPDGILEKKIYFVTRLNEDEFTVSATPTGTAISPSGQQYGYQTWIQVLSPTVKNFTTTIEAVEDQDTLLSGLPEGLQSGDQIYITTTGTLPVGISQYTLYTVGTTDPDTHKFKIEYSYAAPIQASGTQTGTHTVHVVRYPVSIQCSGHRFIDGDKMHIEFKDVDVSIDTSGWAFPAPFAGSTQEFTVSSTALSYDTFMIKDSSGSKMYFDVAPTYGSRFTAFANINEEDLPTLIVLPTLDDVVLGMTIESVSGTGRFTQNTRIIGIDADHKRVTLSAPIEEPIIKDYINPINAELVTNIVKLIDRVQTTDGKAGITSGQEKSTQRTGIIKNSLSNSYSEDGQTNSQQFSTQSATVQSSAFIMHGSTSVSDLEGPSVLSYVHKPLEDRFVHFGTRMRIVGQFNNNEVRGQSAVGAGVYYTASPKSSDQTATISGASGGIAILVDPATNNGYYLELAALSESNLTKYAEDTIHDVLFYKIQRSAEAGTSNSTDAIPVKLWGGLSGINIDTGLFADQSRLTSSNDPSVYDVAVEYKEDGSALVFQIFINGSIIATVRDSNPISGWKTKNNVALFIRGGSRVMFENLHALACNYAENTVSSVGTLQDSVFGKDIDIDVSTAFTKYSLPGMIQSTYLSGISVNGAPNYSIYYEEFGTIMREAAHFTVRYDKAFPALTAQIAPTFNKNKGYMISGFTAGAYGAEFLVFNITDTILNLDSTSGNYLRILGVALTQQSTHELTVDDYYSSRSDLSNPQFSGDSLLYSPVKVKREYQDIKFSRITNGKKDFSLTVPYVQTQDAATDLMGWIASKVMKPRKSVGVKVFGMPTLQLGDIVDIDYVSKDGNIQISKADTRFVVYSVEYSRASGSGPEMIVYLSEVN